MNTVPTNPADCDRTTVYTGECRNFADTEWIRFDSGRRRDASDGNTWLVDVGNGSFWMADEKVRNLVRLVPARPITRADLPDHDAIRDADNLHGTGMRSTLIEIALDAVVEYLNANGGVHVPMGRAANNMLRETLANVERDRARWRRAHGIVEQERDQARAERNDARDACRLFQQDVHEWRVRAEAAEARLGDAAVRESDLPEAEQDEDGDWIVDGGFIAASQTTAETVRGWIPAYLRSATCLEAVARAIEAEQAVDPVEEKAIELHQVAYGGRIGFGHATLNAQEMFRSLARHVLGQEATR